MKRNNETTLSPQWVWGVSVRFGRWQERNKPEHGALALAKVSTVIEKPAQTAPAAAALAVPRRFVPRGGEVRNNGLREGAVATSPSRAPSLQGCHATQ